MEEKEEDDDKILISFTIYVSGRLANSGSSSILESRRKKRGGRMEVMGMEGIEGDAHSLISSSLL